MRSSNQIALSVMGIALAIVCLVWDYPLWASLLFLVVGANAFFKSKHVASMKNLENPEKDDLVHHTIEGKIGRIAEIDRQRDSPLNIDWGSGDEEWYTIDGKMFPDDLNPTVCYGPPMERTRFPQKEGKKRRKRKKRNPMAGLEG